MPVGKQTLRRALHIFSGVGCKDVRNVALLRVEIFLVDGTLVQDLNLNLNLFPPGREKSIDILTISINHD